jgi:putative tricarboxylic transport membrane protein
VSGYAEFEEQIKAGKLRPLAVSADAAEQGVKSFKEQGYDVTLYNWRGVFGAPGISDAQRAALIKLMERLANGPAWKATLANKGWEGIFLSGDAYGKYVSDEVARITTVLKELGIAT